MRNLLRYLLRNYAFVLFLLMEGIALTLFIQHHSYQRAKYLNSANWVTGSIYETFNSVVEYFRLARSNKELARENAELRTLIENFAGTPLVNDSMLLNLNVNDSAFQFVPARVINNSVNRPFNYFTVNKGEMHGVKADQGVISENGIVGVITQVSERYAVGISVLNRRWSISAMLQKSGNFGSLVWQGPDYQIAELTEIPLHVDISEGDTIITSGYSAIFPKGIMVGTIDRFSRPQGENYYSVKVKLSTNFKVLEYVEIIENINRSEIIELEKLIGNDTVAN